jgi:hypothetical protein
VAVKAILQGMAFHLVGSRAARRIEEKAILTLAARFVPDARDGLS